MYKIPPFKKQSKLFEYLIENKEMLMLEKKSEIKHADGFAFNNVVNLIEQKADPSKENTLIEHFGITIKDNKPIADWKQLDQIQVRAGINSTNFMDGHDDVHLNNLFKKSLKENKLIKHIQEHIMKFNHIISDKKDLKAFTKEYTWKELGYKYAGSTQLLVFDSIIKTDRNKYMFEQYAKGHVDNHSVGMFYVQLYLAVNSDSKYYKEEFEVWEKYYDIIANKELADAKGYFWAVKEAKAIEGSAVPIGSNTATPTIDNNIKEPSQDTLDNEPPKGTQLDKINYLTNNLKL